MEKYSNSRIYSRMYGFTFIHVRDNHFKNLEDVYEWASTDKEAKEIFGLAEDPKYYWLAVRDSFNDCNEQVAQGKKPEYNKPITKLFNIRYGNISV